MLKKIPSIRSTAFTDSRYQLPVDESGRILIAGPRWIKETVDLLTDPVWHDYVWAGEAPAGNPPAVTVSAPDGLPAPRSLPEAAYHVTTNTTGVHITCESRLGLVQALRTLAFLSDGNASVPCGTVDDSPTFPWRGMHLDVGRHMFSVDFIKKLLRLMASLGFNVFHWHLTEDQGWRIHIDSYPRLTDVGAYRVDADGSAYGGFYTKQQVREIVAYAGSLGILVVPEIELPGHASAAIAAYPELSCREEPIEVQTEWGVCEDVFCPGNDVLFEFLTAVFGEIADLFPSEIVHIGGDECMKTRWADCPKCRSRVKSENLSNLEELQSYTVSRAAQILADLDRRAIGWDEILEGGLPAGTLVMSWRGTEGGIKAAHAGHNVVMTPTSHCYFDYRQLHGPDAFGFSFRDENGNIPVTTVETVYEFDPLAGLSQDARKNVLGGQANLWSELLSSEELAESQIAPRILSMAEVLWAYPVSRDFQAFRPRVQAALEGLRASGWRPAEVPELA